MTQLSLRVPDDVAREVKRAARAAGKSVNAWIVFVIRSAIDPDLAGDEAERLRERLRRAALLWEPGPDDLPPPRPDPRELQRAMRAAGRGTPLSDLVSRDRD